MKNLLTLFIAIVSIISCQKDWPKKIKVCHRENKTNWHIININTQAWPAHSQHGDILLEDFDKDGYVPTNACDYGLMGDCNDSNANINPNAKEICSNGRDENCNGTIDEDCYASVKICDQTWMLKNLDLSTYRNGDPIPEITDPIAWINATTGAWCYYNNDATNGSVYGKLYNWYAVNDPRGLAPAGWHIPDISEWIALAGNFGPPTVSCLGGSWLEGNIPGGLWVAGGKMKATGTVKEGTSLWKSPNIGATNSSGFTALPSGMRLYSDGSFTLLSTHAFIWSSSEASPTQATAAFLFHSSAQMDRTSFEKNFGFAVRCIKD
jgi:uncharacterized protein (TIGR02145 family)